ncbi:MFS general substrate transporter [Leucogyrophana mollusca]|uniref:MFS general substrate transporter n=1 Tax=Leucogyrophana mollusca TaxID=85980 RepID=A0ACB8B9A4_9AGAM|nr:MFS general substrate transporter [Leucogyrophana mollusca]
MRSSKTSLELAVHQAEKHLELQLDLSLDLDLGLDPESASSALPSSASLALPSSPLTAFPPEPLLAPLDTGFGAWSYLAAAFFVEGIVWGYPMAYGTFLNAYLTDTQYVSQPHAASALPIVGPLSSGMIYCSGSVMNPLMARFPRFKRGFVWIGALLCFVSLFSASYTTNVVHLVVLQGFLYGIGGSLLYAPAISYLAEWFVRRRGMANGVIFAGTGIGGFLFPLILPSLLVKFGPSKCLRILSIALAAILLPFLPFVKGRLPVSRGGPEVPGQTRSELNNVSFWFILVANTVHGLGFFVPFIWLPTFANALGAGPTESSLSLALLNGSVAISGVCFGVLADKMNPWTLALCSATLATLATFLLWGVVSTTLGGMIAFGVVYGLFGGGWTSLWTSFIQPIAAEDPALANSLFGYLLLSRGLGNILSTPISTALFVGSASSSSVDHHVRTGFDVGGGQFEKVIIYTGACLAVGALVIGCGALVRRKAA